MTRSYKILWIAALACTLVIALAAAWAQPGSRPYLPIALIVPALAGFVTWRQAANDVRLRSLYDSYAFREIVRRERRRVENW